MTNELQQEAIDTIISIAKGKIDDKYFGIYGAGGVGKSYTIEELVRQAKELKLGVVVTATTGKASSLIGGKTIHSYLGMRMELNQEAEQEDEAMRLGQPTADVSADILIIDEASMIDRATSQAIRSIDRRFKCIVFVGDPMQLPPVKSKKPNLFGIPHIILIEQQRMKHPALNRLANDMRLLIDNELSSIDLNEYIDGDSVHRIEHIDNSNIDINSSALAYHNIKVEEYIPLEHGSRYNLFSNVTTLRLTDKGFVTEVVYPNGSDLELTLSQEGYLDSLPTTRKGNHYKVGDFLLPKVDGLPNQFITMSEDNIPFIVHKGKKAELTKFREKYFQIAKDYKAKLEREYGKAKDRMLANWKYTNLSEDELKKWNDVWSEYSNTTSIIHVRPTEARTLHKSQGSTLTNVFVDLDDVLSARGSHLHALYVAFTRATDNLYIKGEESIIWAE